MNNLEQTKRNPPHGNEIAQKNIPPLDYPTEDEIAWEINNLHKTLE